jgi:prevent-host-death family protein
LYKPYDFQMKKIDTSQARQAFSDTLSQVAFGGDRIVLSRHGKDVAALIPMMDLELLQDCEEERRSKSRRPRRAARPASRKGGEQARAGDKRTAGSRGNPRPRRPGRRRQP